MDMTQTIVPKSDQLTADDLISGPRTITFVGYTVNEGNADQPVNFRFEGDDGKPFRPCKIMRRLLVAVWGADASKYSGKSLTIYRDPKVKWGGLQVGGIRISHMEGLQADKKIALTETRGKKVVHTVKPLKVEPKADKAAEGAAKLIERIKAAADVTEVENDPQVVIQRKWLADNRPDLSEQVDAAINETSMEGAE